MYTGSGVCDRHQRMPEYIVYEGDHSCAKSIGSQACVIVSFRFGFDEVRTISIIKQSSN